MIGIEYRLNDSDPSKFERPLKLDRIADPGKSENAHPSQHVKRQVVFRAQPAHTDQSLTHLQIRHAWLKSPKRGDHFVVVTAHFSSGKDNNVCSADST